MALLGSNVQLNDNFQGYYPTRELIFDSGGSTWTSSNVNNELRTDFFHMGPFPVSSPCTFLGYNQELVKQTILKHEAIFKDQIRELHRVYHKQRELMDEIRSELHKQNVRLEASWSSSALSSKHGEKIFYSSNLPWSTSQSSFLFAESIQLPPAFAQEKSRQIFPARASTVTEESLKDYTLPESTCRKVGKKILDLELPADEYIDSDEGEENVQFKLDLNVPFRLEVETAAKSNNMEAPTNHMNNFLYDLSMRTKFGSQNFHDDVFNKRQNLEGSSHNQLKDNERKCDWKSSGLNGGLLDSLDKDILTEKQSVSVDSSCKNMEQFDDLSSFHSSHQVNRGPSTKTIFSSSESSARNGFLGAMGLPCLKELPVVKGKPNEESTTSTQIESVVLNPHTSSDHGFATKHFQNQAKNQRIEEIEKELPCVDVSDIGEQIPSGEHLITNEKKRKHEYLAGIIDLNSSMIEDENVPIDVDFHAPASPENKECSPPRGESDENQLATVTPFQFAEQEDPHVQEEQTRIAAEALVSISGFVTQKDIQMATCSSSESSANSSLNWFAAFETMKKEKLNPFLLFPNKPKFLHIFMTLMLLYLIFTTFEFKTFESVSVSSILRNEIQNTHHRKALNFASDEAFSVHQASLHRKPMQELQKVSTLSFNEGDLNETGFEKDKFSEIQRDVKVAWIKGKRMWEEIQSLESENVTKFMFENQKNHSDSCQHSISLSGSELRNQKGIMVIPCGLTLWSHVTVVGTPRLAHWESDPKINVVKDEEEKVLVSQFMMELQGLKVVDEEEPPKILHFNPRLKGDYSGKPVIEQNTCYRMQWGSSLRCEGWKSRADEDTVDGQVKCEKWIRDDDSRSEESNATWWLPRMIGRKHKITLDWPYPFIEGRLFVLTLTAGLEGYHVSVDGKHVTSFPYRTGFSLEDATGLSIKGDVDVHSIYAASLPTSHPSFAPQMHLELLPQWKAPPILDVNVELFVGIISAGNHFAERMAVRKSWMQHKLIKSSHVVARFFVALHARKDINLDIKKEADYFGDIIIVPYMDHYDLVVVKTVAIAEYGIRNVAAKNIMKCDDDTFVRLDSIISEVRKVGIGRSLYIGNMNYHHTPLRDGKWAVTYEEWAEEEYPTYANGPGYIISSDIAKFIVSNFEEHKLKLFKMEDVSMGMWVEQFNNSTEVEYVHSYKFCQFGCIEGYYTAHYQSPRQMTCMWDKLQDKGKPLCCNNR